MIKIGIDPAGTGTSAIVVYKNGEFIEKLEFINKDWKWHSNILDEIIWRYPNQYATINIEDCLYTSANSSKDRDDLLRLLGAFEKEHRDEIINWVSPSHTKSVVKNIENLSKYNNCIQEFSKDENLTYEYGKGWKYNNEKISNHIRDAIIMVVRKKLRFYKKYK